MGLRVCLQLELLLHRLLLALPGLLSGVGVRVSGSGIRILGSGFAFGFGCFGCRVEGGSLAVEGSDLLGKVQLAQLLQLLLLPQRFNLRLCIWGTY